MADGLSGIPRMKVSNYENEVYPQDKFYNIHPINKFKNQIFLRVTDNKRKSPYSLIQIFPGYTRHVYHQPNYNEESRILKEQINQNTTNGIFAPLEVAKQCGSIAAKHLKDKVKIEFCNL